MRHCICETPGRRSAQWRGNARRHS